MQQHHFKQSSANTALSELNQYYSGQPATPLRRGEGSAAGGRSRSLGTVENVRRIYTEEMILQVLDIHIHTL
jgi:hypothetical protein